MRRCVLMALWAAAGLLAQGTGRIAGRITTDKGQPLKGEVIAVLSAGGVRMSSFATDGQGVFGFDVPVGRALLLAKADGYISEERQLVVHPGAGNPSAQFKLSPAGSVSGRVFSGDGAGAAAARVWVGYPGETRAWRSAEEAGGEAADAFGYFTVPAVAQGRPFVLHAESDEWLMSSSGTLMLRGPEMAGVVLLLGRRGSNVRGKVFDAAGSPLAGAAIRLRAVPDRNEFTADQRASAAFARSINKSTASAADGSFAFAGIPSGKILLTASARGRRAATEAAIIAGRDTEVVLRLK